MSRLEQLNPDATNNRTRTFNGCATVSVTLIHSLIHADLPSAEFGMSSATKNVLLAPRVEKEVFFVKGTGKAYSLTLNVILLIA